MSYKPEIFSITDENKWKSYLDEYGFVVLGNILDNETYTELFKQFYIDWNTITPNFNFHDKNTWTEFNSPINWNIGMISGYGSAHAKFQWGLRTNNNIIDIWKKLHNTDELVVSYDGFSFFCSPEQEPNIWLHIDQNPKDNLYSIQGAYNFLPVNEDDAGFVVVPGSHKTFFVDVPEEQKFIPVEHDDIHVDYAVKLLIPQNCFVLWNSKTIHANTGMSKTKDVELNRITSYISYFPKEQRTDDIYQERLYGYFYAENCSHYAIAHHVKYNNNNIINNFKFITPELNENDEIPEKIINLI